ncbi:type IV toxin-antitoxin system AbiEi family antitoxin [uncultured Sphaerochaeta sp.]|uniref:type IV toxin-antitoxin system AbiEi family antitoxin domain-containing protein n=2 Tax=uncultured Sphaerochaeta sp. TaxID=886478 RepID=UPI002A0A4DA2|nr:type IV toxin-antitoxin system AbiEi family antitoxin [uncultured Sphaerochaeta sp.]
MHYYMQLLKLGCFSRDDVARITGNVRTADSLLYSYKKKSYIVSIKRNLFTAIDPTTGEPVCNQYEIGSCLSTDSYISHHSAFEVHGMANQVLYDVNISSSSRFTPFDFNGHRYMYIASSFLDGVETHGRIRVTDLERTIVDTIKDFTKVSGLEELLACLSLVTYIDERKLMHYLSCYDIQFLYQKAGYILSLFPGTKISKQFLISCEKQIQKSIRYLTPETKQERATFQKRWGLYVPSNINLLVPTTQY